MTTIYVVTKGEYSDYRIAGVFSYFELANEYIQLHHNPDDFKVETYELDSYQQQIRAGMLLYCVRMQKNGNTLGVYEEIDVEESRIGTPQLTPGYNVNEGRREAKLELYTYAFDEQHAAKIANEKRVVMIAMGEWDAYENGLPQPMTLAEAHMKDKLDRETK